MEKIKGQMKELIGVNADDDEEEIKSKVTKNVLNKMRSEGYDVDPEKPQESMKKMLDMARDRAGESLGLQITDETSQEEIKEKIMDKLESQGIPCSKCLIKHSRKRFGANVMVVYCYDACKADDIPVCLM